LSDLAICRRYRAWHLVDRHGSTRVRNAGITASTTVCPRIITGSTAAGRARITASAADRPHNGTGSK
jgi:hypothetical protein